MVRSEVVQDVEGTSSGSLAGFVLVDVAWWRAFESLVQHERDPEFGTCLEAIEVLSRAAEGIIERVKVRETHRALWMTMRYTLDYVHDPARREIRWSLDKSGPNDMARNTGAWRFIPIGDDRTLLAYQASGETSGWVPRFIQDAFLKAGLSDFLAATKKRVEATGDQPASGGLRSEQ